MGIPATLEIVRMSANYMQFQFADGLNPQQNPTYLNDLTVTGELFAGRQPYDPQQNPGQQVSAFGTVDFLYVSGSNGIYRAVVGPLLGVPLGGNYVLVLDATDATYQGHWELPVVIITD